MRNTGAFLVCALLLIPVSAQVPAGWTKVSGPAQNWSGQTDGILADRSNSYAWSMDILDDALYVGTNRNIFAMMVVMAGLNPWPAAVPPVAQPDLGPGIYRMQLTTRQWSLVHRSQADIGYRMMKTFQPRSGPAVLYAGSATPASCRLLAIERSGVVTPIFQSPVRNGIATIRSIAEHDGRLYWAADTAAQPGIWHSPDPLGDYRAARAFSRLPDPDPAMVPARAEVADMISAFGWLYVFYISHPAAGTPPGTFLDGFWSIKGKWQGNRWVWQPLVGNGPGALYPAGVDSFYNGAAVPFRFRNHVYVGTLDGNTFRMMANLSGSSMPGPIGVGLTPETIIGIMGGRNGMRIYRFDQRDRYEPVMPTLSGSAGFDNPLNKYIWRFGEQNGTLYAGTFDISTGVDVLSSGQFTYDLTPRGFDLCSTRDGLNWSCLSRNGFNDPYNYGVRSFVSDPRSGALYLGTANPFYGCQVWMRAPGAAAGR